MAPSARPGGPTHQRRRARERVDASVTDCAANAHELPVALFPRLHAPLDLRRRSEAVRESPLADLGPYRRARVER
jgi:hypothetical protein